MSTASFLELYHQFQLDDYITALAWSPQRDWLSIAAANGEVQLLQGLESQVLQPARWKVTATWIDRLAWHSQDNLLAFSQGKTVQVWDPEASTVQVQLSAPGMVQDIAWSPDGNCLAIAAKNEVHVW